MSRFIGILCLSIFCVSATEISSAQPGLRDSVALLLAKGDSIVRGEGFPHDLAGRQAYRQNHRRAAALYRTAAGVALALGDQKLEADAFERLAMVYFQGTPLDSSGDATRDSSIMYGRRSINARRGAGDRRELARGLSVIGRLATRSSAARDSGLAYLKESSSLFRAVGLDTMAAQSYADVADIYEFRLAGSALPQVADSMIKYARAADSLATRGGNTCQASMAVRRIATAFRRIGRPDSASSYHRHDIQVLQRRTTSEFTNSDCGRTVFAGVHVGASLEVPSLLDELGQDFEELGYADSASAFYHQSVALYDSLATSAPLGPARASKDLGRVAVLSSMRRSEFGRLASLSERRGMFDSVLYYARLAEPPAKQQPQWMQWEPLEAGQSALLNGSAFRRAGRTDSALFYSRRALVASKRADSLYSGDIKEIARLEPSIKTLALQITNLSIRSQQSVALAFMRSGRPDSALEYLRSALSIETLDRQAPLLFDIGAAHRLGARPDSARVYLLRALANAREQRSGRVEVLSLAQLAMVYQALGQQLTALAYTDSAIALRRSLGMPIVDLSSAPSFESDSAEQSQMPATRAPMTSIIGVAASEADSSVLTIAVAAADRGGGVSDVRLYDNGTPIATSARRIGLTTGDNCPHAVFCFEVSLPPGRHSLEAAAAARDGTEGNRAVRPVNVPGPRRRSRLYVFAVGIDQYDNPTYSLNYARADAQAVIDSLQAGNTAFAGAPVVETLYDRSATHDAIERRLITIARQAKPEDVFVLYYAGHGKETTIGATTSFFLVPADVANMGDDDSVGARGISSARLMELLRNIPSRQKILLIDACQSGGVASAYTWQEPTKDALSRLATSSGTWVMAASRPQQVAAESPEFRHGLFTYALLRALGTDGSGRPHEITVAGLFNNVQAWLPGLSHDAHTPMQTPIAVGAGEFFTLAIR